MNEILDGIRIIINEYWSMKVLVARIVDYSFLHSWLQLLSPEEINRYQKYKYSADAIKFAARRAFVRKCLAKHLHIAPEQIQYSYSSAGKPYLNNNPVFFNWSFSKDHFALAIASDQQIGIDIEYIDPKMYFSLLWQKITGLPQTKMDREVFFRFWTAREAIAKKIGEGLSEDIFKQELVYDKRSGLIKAPALQNIHIEQFNSVDFMVALARNADHLR